MYYTGFAITLLCLFGCSVFPPSSTETPLAATPTSLPGVTPSPSPTPPTDVPTPSPIPSPTLTVQPTLTADERLVLVRDMLETNAGCELPCWWGINPGKTTWQATRDFFSSQGIGTIMYEGALYYYFDPPLLERSVLYNLELHFVQREGVVYSIGINSQVLGDPKSNRFPQDWHRYALDQVLTRHGAPSQVMLEFWPNPPGPYYPYSLFVFYDHLGILIRYGGSAIPGEPFRMCPDLAKVEYLNLWLRSPGEGPALLELANLDRAELAQMLSLKEATGMDIQTFYKTFREAGAAVCLESPAAVWP